ncbi:MAG: endolytic transglycosylase MltG [Shewanella sp.]|nr:endolytic transglycosylase MltG [Shewanella sp.]MCF1430644.1 endolytic transglycosylase MltG [Shewanella sp.]MCF1437336.1 endolytic transglycosylase MltG [Shewanella sp.]MCF1456953.1 endolytic transglycosylase MltG [Shewanella sp.]
MKFLWGALATLMTLALIAAGGAYWGLKQVEAFAGAPLTLDTSRQLEIKPGTNVRQLVRQLAVQGVTENDWRIKALLKLYPELAQIRAGLYEILPGETLSGLLEQLSQGKVMQFPLTLVEGRTIAQWQTELAQAPHLNYKGDEFAAVMAAQGDTGLPEGRFYPDTYYYEAGHSARKSLTQSYLRMQQELAVAWEGRDKSLPLKTPYELLILASIIEKETAKPEERGWVAAVFANRLRKGMRLQTDPTVIYGMGERYQGNITKKDLRELTPYNTYRIDGLPPSPIAAPSRASLLAAANPADVDYLYFVSRNDGSHVFSRTLAEHSRAVNKFQRKQK